MKKKLTKKDIKGYLTHGLRCPFCGTDAVNFGEREYQGPMVMNQYNQCKKCKRTWTDEYTLTGMTPDEEE